VNQRNSEKSGRFNII